jgi:hypothetical protein
MKRGIVLALAKASYSWMKISTLSVSRGRWPFALAMPYSWHTGLHYSYRLEVRFTRSGKAVKLEKQVEFTADTEQRVSFRTEAKKE